MSDTLSLYHGAHCLGKEKGGYCLEQMGQGRRNIYEKQEVPEKQKEEVQSPVLLWRGSGRGGRPEAGALPPTSNLAASVEGSRKPPQRLRADQKHKICMPCSSPGALGGSPTWRVPTST